MECEVAIRGGNRADRPDIEKVFGNGVTCLFSSIIKKKKKNQVIELKIVTNVN